MKNFYCVILFIILIPGTVSSQDLEKIKDAKPVTISGGLGLGSGWYNVSGTDLRRDPFTWNINANLNFNIYSVLDVPFSVIITKGDHTLNRPTYSHYGISPKYKFITAHIGYRSMNFSSYSYSGLTFLGGGIELKPEKSIFNFAFMYGRFNEAVPVNMATTDVTRVRYARYGWGTLFGIGKGKHHVDFILFKAKDDTSSINMNADSVSGSKPQENLVLGIISSNRIAKKITLKVEYTVSYLSLDLASPHRKLSGFSIANYLGSLYKPGYSTTVNHVINGSVNYQGNGYSFGFSYKWIDPEYKSLGTSFSANDAEDWMLNGSKSILGNKLNFTGSLGIQRNNLARNLENTNKRNIYSLNSTYAFNENWNFGVNYSNFASSSLPSVIQLQDSIKYIQTTTNKGASVNFNKGSEKITHSISALYNIQDANTLNQTFTEAVSNKTKVTSGTVSYSISLVPLEVSINSAFNYSRFTQDSIYNLSIGPSVGAGRSFFNKKVNTSLAVSFLKQDNGLNTNSNVTVVNLSVTYRFLKNHNISMNNSISVNKSNDINLKRETSELVGSIRYSYNFSK